MRTRIIVAHGLNTKDGGRGSTDKLIPGLRKMGFDVDEGDTGYMFLLRARLGTPVAAAMLESLTRNDPRRMIGVGFSNGCNVLSQAAQLGARFDRLVYLSPALNRKTKLARQVKRCDVLHTRRDFWTDVAALIPLSKMGPMGARGAAGPDMRYVNQEHSERIHWHDQWFSEKNIDYTTNVLAKLLAREVNT